MRVLIVALMVMAAPVAALEHGEGVEGLNETDREPRGENGDGNGDGRGDGDGGGFTKTAAIFLLVLAAVAGLAIAVMATRREP